jgi:ankyrin repeat protein
MFTKTVYLSIVLIVTIAVGGCIMWPGKTTYDTPEKPTGLTEGKTHNRVVLEKLGNPAEQTEDGRLALHDYMRTRRLHMVTIPWETPGYAVDEFQARLLLLVMYDENNIIERLETYKCKSHYKSGDPVCRSQHSVCGVLIEMDDQALVQRYCDTTTVDYFRNVALVESLREPLRDAVRHGNPEEIEQLIAQGADIHGPGEARRTPLLLVAVKKGHIDAARLLLDKGADVSETTPFMGYTALQIAAKDRNTDLIETLLAHGANVNAGGKTPLYFAASNGDIANARLLIAAGADVNTTSRTDTPLYRAVKKHHEDMAKLLIATGADVNAGRLDKIPLIRAVKQGDEWMVERLIAAGADVNVGPWGKEPLFRAVKQGDEHIAKLLIAQGANVSTTDAKGRTPLHLAAAKGRTKLAEFLLVNGADVNVKDSRGKAPLHLAVEWRRKETIEVLKQYGAKE